MDIWKSRVQETLIRPENNLTICLKQILIPNGTTNQQRKMEQAGPMLIYSLFNEGNPNLPL